MKDLNEKNGKRTQICIRPNMALIGNKKISFGLTFYESKTNKEGRREEEEEEGKRRRRREGEEEFKEDQRYGIMCTFGLW